jgi:hypothetical protein
MDAKLTKSLTDLIDETLSELEELKKSSRYSASEIKIEGPGADGIAGKPANGELDKKDEEKKEDDKEEKEKDMDKAEDKSDEKKDEDKAEDMDKKEDKKEEDKKEPHKDDPKHEDKEKKLAEKLLDMHKDEMKKSREEMETLAKSYVDEKVKPLEDKLSTILDLVNKLSDAPVAPRGATARTAPLFKSAGGADQEETLSKSEVASKLFDLKKSGTKVDTNDIARAEMGQDLEQIVKKYKIS